MQSVLPSKQKSAYSVPQSIGQKLVDLRGLISRFVVSQSLIILAIWLLAAFWTFGLLDYLPPKFGAAESPRAVRIVMLILLVSVSVYLIYRFLWHRWKVRWSDSSLALLIENRHPEFQSSLITTVQAANPTSMIDTSIEEHPQRSGFLELARVKASQLIEKVEVNELVRFRPLQMQLVALGILLGSSCVFALLQPDWTLHWGKRFFALSDVPWPRLTELGVDGIEMDVPTFAGRNNRQRYLVPFRDGVASVPKGQACQLKTWAKLSGKIVPEVCTVYYRDVDGNRGRANMRRLTADKSQQSFALDGPPLESVNESLWLSVAGGDARISNLQLNSVEAPQVTQLQINVTYPEYLQRSTTTTWGNETIPYRTGMRLPQGSQLNLQMQTNKPVEKCDFVLVRAGEAVDKALLPEQSLAIQDDQSEFQMQLGVLDGNLLIELRLWDTDGICSSRVQQFVISAITDQPPQVDLTLQGIGTSITENAMLPIAGKIKDDYDVKGAWVETVLDANSLLKTPLAVQPDGKATNQLDLKAMRDAGQLVTKVGSTLGLTVAAEDYLNLRDEPHIGRASPIQLSVVTPEQLLILLERRELAMRARLEQIIGELSQMRDLLVNMQKAAKVLAIAHAATGSQTDAVADKPLDEIAADTEENSPARRERMQMLRSQQAESQMTKSEGELRGVEREITQINQELINNRIDSVDRRTRLEDKIRKPLLVVLDQSWVPMAKDVREIEKSFSKSIKADSKADELLPNAIEKSNQIIVALTEILSDMINIQDFNEVLDMVRGIIDEQGKVLEKTKQEQKKQLLDLP
ncbi:MAG: hypothetical protein NTY15_14280 [Planctomycetota bacterium]|nr:hypothetical protein [Planctomycetota bacterium]